jgi:hypothetical protein
MTESSLVGFAVFTSTLVVIVLHGVEWFQIGKMPKAAVAVEQNQSPTKLTIIKVGLGVETVYYFLLLIVFVVFFAGNIVLSILIALLGLAHLGAFQAILRDRAYNWLGKLTNRRVAGVLLFDAIEVVILITLAAEFYPAFRTMI